MIRNNQYILRKLHHTNYLIPVGQAVADWKKTHQLNSTGVFLWHLLRKECTIEELLLKCAEHFTVSPESGEDFRHDIRTYIDVLISKGLVTSTSSVEDIREPFCACLSVAGMNCNLYSQDASVFSKFHPFLSHTEAASANQYIVIQMKEPAIRENGCCLLRNDELWVMECPNFYVLLFPTMKKIKEVRLSKDGTMAHIHCCPPYDDVFRENLFHVIRHIFLYYSQLHGIIALHSSSILYQNKAWLFTAPSQVGKSTQADLWHRNQGSHIINGDLNLIKIKNEVSFIHGTPWCGTSEIFDSQTYPLGGIFILKQADRDSIEKLTTEQKELLLCQRVISPTWTSRQLDYNLSIIRELSRIPMVCRLHCTKEDSAYFVTKQAIDHYLAV